MLELDQNHRKYLDSWNFIQKNSLRCLSHFRKTAMVRNRIHWMSKTRDSQIQNDWMCKTLNLKLGWMKFCDDMNQKQCASKNLVTRNFTKTQKSEKRKIKIPPTMIRTSFFNTNYEGVHIENRKRKAKPKSQIPPTINSVTDSRYRITSAPLTTRGP